MISAPEVPDGPFGQAERYGGTGARVNALIHRIGAGGRDLVHEFSTAVENLWTSTVRPVEAQAGRMT